MFAPENRWGFFPGMALAWRISQEKFMKQTEDWLDNLKLRVSYGSVGNARVNSYWRQDYKMESSANRQYYLNETVQSALKLQLIFHSLQRETQAHLQLRQQSQQYLSLYSQAQTARLTLQEHLKRQALMLSFLS